MKLVNFLKIRFPVRDEMMYLEVNGINYAVLPCPVTGRSGDKNTYEGITLKQLELLTRVFPEILEEGFEKTAKETSHYPSGSATRNIYFTLSSLHCAVSQAVLRRCIELGQLFY